MIGCLSSLFVYTKVVGATLSEGFLDYHSVKRYRRTGHSRPSTTSPFSRSHTTSYTGTDFYNNYYAHVGTRLFLPFCIWRLRLDDAE